MADKDIHIVYYGKDGDKAKEMAVGIRAERKTAHIRHAESFDGSAEECAEVTILSCVSGHDAGRIRAAYGDKVCGAPVAVPLPKVGDEPSETITLPKVGDEPAAIAPLAAPLPPPPPVPPTRKAR